MRPENRSILRCSLFALALLPPATLLSASAPTPPPVAAASKPAPLRFANYGVEVTPPAAAAGWTLEGCPPAGTVARWTRREAPAGEIVAEMTIRWEPSTKPLKETAKAAAEKEGAVVLDGAFELDRFPAVAIRKDTRDEKGPPGLRFECDRGTLRFSVSVRGIIGDAPMRELVELGKTVRWFPPERLTSGAILWAAEPAVLLNGEITATLPLGFHQEPMRKEFDGNSQWVGVLNFGTGDSEVVISFKSLALKLHKPSTLDLTKPPTRDFKDNFAAGFERAVNSRVRVEAYTLAAPQRGVITDMVTGTTADGQAIHCRAARLYDDGHLLQAQAIIFSKDPQEIDKWSGVIERIMASIRFTPTGPAPAPSGTPR